MQLYYYLNFSSTFPLEFPAVSCPKPFFSLFFDPIPQIIIVFLLYMTNKNKRAKLFRKDQRKFISS